MQKNYYLPIIFNNEKMFKIKKLLIIYSALPSINNFQDIKLSFLTELTDVSTLKHRTNLY